MHYGVVSVAQEDCIKALSVPIEDALVAVCAQKAGADYIVTRDDKFLRDKSQVKIITPKELIDTLHD